jgi:hypothetical protein
MDCDQFAYRCTKFSNTAFSGEGLADLILGAASANAVTSNMTPEQMILRKMRSMARAPIPKFANYRGDH